MVLEKHTLKTKPPIFFAVDVDERVCSPYDASTASDAPLCLTPRLMAPRARSNYLSPARHADKHTKLLLNFAPPNDYLQLSKVNPATLGDTVGKRAS